MKSILLFFAMLLLQVSYSQSAKVFVESSAGSASIASNNSLVVERYSSPMVRSIIGYDLNNLRVGVSTGRTEYGFSTSSYSVSSVGLVTGYNIDFDVFGICADAIFDYRLASLQRVGGQQFASRSLSPLDLVLRPSFFVRPIKSSQSIELVVGYELGLIDLDPTDASTGINAQHRAFTVGARLLLMEPSKPRKTNTTL
jgi:hypothetical protein